MTSSGTSPGNSQIRPGAVVISRDVTDRAALEDALKRAKEEAERANLAKSEFLSRMSHELRTPLNAVLGFGQLLEMDGLTEEQADGVQQILKAGRHLLDLINEVLDIARIDSGQLAISPEPVNLGDSLREAMSLMDPLAADHHVQLRDEGGLSDVHVLADRQRLKQVLLNLLSNAIKYNREWGTVTISHRMTPEGEHRVDVTDTGAGIDPAHLDHLFIPFERLGAEQTGVEGTGIGLALSKRLTELMAGQIGVESRLGEGSTFWVQLPQAESPIDELQRAEQGLEVPAEWGGSPRKVLYIEDNLSNLKLIERVLTLRPAVDLLPTMQGRLGLELAREHHPDLILLDLHLPDMGGREVLDRLRLDPETAGIPVVIISADATPGQVKRLLAAGATDYLTKPLDVSQFLRVLDDNLTQGVDGDEAG